MRTKISQLSDKRFNKHADQAMAIGNSHSEKSLYKHADEAMAIGNDNAPRKKKHIRIEGDTLHVFGIKITPAKETR